MSETSSFGQCMVCGSIFTKYTGTSICADCLLQMEMPVLEFTPEAQETLQSIMDNFRSDVHAAFEKDPAAYSIAEVLTSYPGIKATLVYRVTHFLYSVGMPFVPRYLSEIARQLTSIDIHPGATIGKEFFIDHGIGVVIGETAEIGDNVTIYQGVTLGGVSTERGKRHPTVGNNVVIGAGAKILGPITIGDNVRIGSNSVVTKDVPDNSVVVGVPGRIVSRNGEQIPRIDLRHADLPDPVIDIIQHLEDRITTMEKQLLDQRDVVTGSQVYSQGSGI